MDMPGPGAHVIGEEELREVEAVVRSGFLSRYGPDADPAFLGRVLALEEAFSELTGARYALAVNSGTAALYLSYLGLGLGPGDEVIVPGFTFVATMSAAAYVGATLVLAEIDETLNLDPADVEAKITPNTKAIVLVHMLGNPGRIAEVQQVAERYGVPVVEDCAQALGASYAGRSVGGFGAAGTFSFNEYKTITCGDGGLLVMNDDDLYYRCFAMHDQGHRPLRNGVEVGRRPFLGMNFRMTELQAAVMIAQMRKLPAIVERLRGHRDIVLGTLASVDGLAFRVLPDRRGDLGTHAVVTFPSADVARLVAQQANSITLDDSGWHVYAKMEHLLNLRMPRDVVRGEHDKSPMYHPDMLPRTNDLLSRSISFGVGVLDENLAPVGLENSDGRGQVEKKAEAFCEIVRRCM